MSLRPTAVAAGETDILLTRKTPIPSTAGDETLQRSRTQQQLSVILYQDGRGENATELKREVMCFQSDLYRDTSASAVI